MLNVAVALVALLVARVTAYRPPVVDESPPSPTRERARAHGAVFVYVAIALSGHCALGSEVIWTRTLSLMLGPTTYTFSIILAVFLTGLGIGSSAGSFLSRTLSNPRAALGWCQLLAAAAIGWTALKGRDVAPVLARQPWLSTSAWFNLQIDIVRCLWALLPASLLWGASFPFALTVAAGPRQDPGRLVGRVYASAAGCAARRSSAIATCACSISRAWS